MTKKIRRHFIRPGDPRLPWLILAETGPNLSRAGICPSTEPMTPREILDGDWFNSLYPADQMLGEVILETPRTPPPTSEAALEIEINRMADIM